MKKLLFLSLIFIQAVCLYSQEMTVTGFVMDEAGVPVSNVHILCETSRRGTVSDDAGWFSLNLPEQPTILSLSHIAFFSKQVDITQEIIAQGKRTGEIDLGIVLKQKTQILSAVEITDGKVTLAYEDAKKWILDYAFIGRDEILFLMIEKNKKYIQLIDTDNKSVAKKQIDGKYSGFHKDCFGNVFLKSENEVCQVFLQDNNNFLLEYQIPMEIFLNTIDKVVAITPNNLYIRDLFIRDQDIIYYKIDTLSKKSTMLYSVLDETGEKLQTHKKDLTKAQKQYNEVLWEEIEMALARLAPIGVFIAMLERSNKDTENYLTFYDYLLSQSPYSPLLKINDMLYIFDHINGKIVMYDPNGNFIKEVEISYYKTQNYGKEIIVDEEKTTVFIKFLNNGYVTLRQINPDTGNFTGNDIVLEKHTYPKQIKIQGDYIYYLARDYFQDENKYFLWKQHLE
jgi:hypothetical protein